MNGHGVAGASNIRPPRFKVTGVHNNFLNSEESRNKYLSIIEDIETSRNTQDDIDRIYDEFYDTYIQEMGIHYRKLEDTPFSKRKQRFTYKEWWDEEVATAWRDMKNAEHDFLKYEKRKLNCNHMKYVFISPTAENLQQMLNEVSNWCLKWGMRINPSKTQVMHIRNKQRPRTSHVFTCGEHKLSITDTYKYLGYILHEHLSNTRHVEVMTGSAVGRLAGYITCSKR